MLSEKTERTLYKINNIATEFKALPDLKELAKFEKDYLETPNENQKEIIKALVKFENIRKCFMETMQKLHEACYKESELESML